MTTIQIPDDVLALVAPSIVEVLPVGYVAKQSWNFVLGYRGWTIYTRTNGALVAIPPLER